MLRRAERKAMSFYDNKDPLDVAVGSFSGMAGVDIKNKVRVNREGVTFAVISTFPYLSLTRSIAKGCDFQGLVREKEALLKEVDKPIDVILPSIQASKLSGLTKVSALGGAEHELGHILIDMGNTYIPSESELKARGVDVMLKQFKAHKDYDKLKPALHKWVNVLADVRLERFMGVLYEPTKSRFHAVQSWVHGLEEEGRKAGELKAGGSIMCIIRDLGKGWANPEQREVLEQYKTIYAQSWELADKTKGIWSKVIPKPDCTEEDIKASVHTPLVVAMELLMAIADLIEKEPPSGGGGSKKGKGKDEEGGGEGGDPASGYGKVGEITDTYQLNDGQALDPSSAMTQAVKQAEKGLDHKVYYDGKMQEKKFSWNDVR